MDLVQIQGIIRSEIHPPMKQYSKRIIVYRSGKMVGWNYTIKFLSDSLKQLKRKENNGRLEQAEKAYNLNIYLNILCLTVSFELFVLAFLPSKPYILINDV